MKLFCMKFIIKSYIWIRNKYIYNFRSNIRAIAKKNNIYYPNFMWYILRIIPFAIIDYTSRLFNFNIIYESDNIFNITNVPNTLKIMPIVTNFLVYLKNDEKINLKNYLKFYNPNIPVKFFLKNNNINSDIKLELNYIKAGIMRMNTYDDYDKLTLHNIFS